ncbi:hypothetical protein Q2T94_10845 [Paeniglutamicibacter sulfureus]|uniref:hypothetical protein n=1 Tax=Paeniglutamicibacter sulfureus TaxID=43666 RepID=UPI002665AB17|nr:hypothetical protein [Paeniglutamicibacter sulfureus]MDO2934801.1 hypothetical protein [Paeniglutamicibacter sulfureus]
MTPRACLKTLRDGPQRPAVSNPAARCGPAASPRAGAGRTLAFFAIILLNLPALVGESSYGPFSFGVLVLLDAALAASPAVALRRRTVVLD